MRVLGVVVLIIGLLALAAGVLYLTQPAHSLPSFFPGYHAHVLTKHHKRGLIGIAVGAVIFLVGLAMTLMGGRRGRHRARWA